MQLTEDGRVFHARARDLLAEVDDLHSMFASDRVALRGRLRVDLPTEVARTTIVPALPDFMATHPELELELSSTDRQVDLVQEGFDCVLRLGPIGDETLIARPLGLLRMVNAASPAYLARYGVPRSLDDLRHQEHRTIHFSTMLGARPYGWEYPDGDSYATLQLPGALHVNSAQTYEAAALAGLGLISGATLGDWPILRKWSACGDHTRFSSPGARRVPRRRTSEQSVAPSPRIHEMDRRCADAVSGIARRTSSSGPRNQHLKLCLSVGGRRPVLAITVEATERSLTSLGCMSPEVARGVVSLLRGDTSALRAIADFGELSVQQIHEFMAWNSFRSN